jgi:hypothetical protein
MDAGSLAEGEICHGQGANVCEPGLQCLVLCTKVCSFSDINDDEPKCLDTCPSGGKFQPINNDNFIGLCLGDTVPQACNLFEQTGCDPGQGCYSIKGGWGCVKAGSTKVGAACQYTNDCAPGTICINSTCAEVCSSHADDKEKNYSCDKQCGGEFNNITPAEWNIGFCTNAEPADPCDFWKQDCVDPDKLCYFVTNGATCLKKGAEKPLNADCKYISDCAKGLYCTQGTCVQPCSLEQLAPPPTPICADDCPGGKFKTLSFENQVGVCDE